MNSYATITSKLQLTIPIVIARKSGVRVGEKLHVSNESGRIVLTPVKKLIAELSGSLSVPNKFKGKDIDLIIKEARASHFKSKK